MVRPSDVEIREVGFDYEAYDYRTPIKFGGAVVDDVTLLNVWVRVCSRRGDEAVGFGSMPLGNVWSFPSKRLSHDQTLGLMKRLAERFFKLSSNYTVAGHPVDINASLEPLYLEAAQDLSEELSLAEPIPKLCTLVVASPFDAAVHDAFGKANSVNCYAACGAEYMSHDLGRHLGPDFAGESLVQYVSPRSKEYLPLYHLVGALDPIFESDVGIPIDDGVPEALTEWIRAEGLTHLKIKLNGDDLAWDVERTLTVDRALSQAQGTDAEGDRHFSLDFNERCPHVDYLLGFLHEIRRRSATAFQRIQYVEQPTARNLADNPQNKMHEAAKLKPVVIDESLVDYDSLLMARDLGYSGVALKACKGLSNALLMAAAAQKFNMFLCVQDLTCPGLSLLHSAGLAAHIPTVAAIESNARQYVPAANEPWKDEFPEVFEVREGRIRTAGLDGPGLGVVPQHEALSRS